MKSRIFFVYCGIALIPFGIGLIIALLIESEVVANQLFISNYSVDLVWLSTRIGLFISLIMLASIFVLFEFKKRLQWVYTESQNAYDATHHQFLQRLDHELKNPLTIMRLGLTNLQTGENFTPEQLNSFSRIQQQTQRLQNLIVALRTLTELDKNPLEKSPIDISALINDAISSSLPEQSQKITVSIQQVPWGVGTILGDYDLLLTALGNLLENALKFTNDSGQVEIRATDDGNFVTLEIADNGIGIADDEQEYIFEELYRGQNAKRISGSGLGLSIVQKIIKLHQASIGIHSREGQGTVFTLKFPLNTDRS